LAIFKEKKTLKSPVQLLLLLIFANSEKTHFYIEEFYISLRQLLKNLQIIRKFSIFINEPAKFLEKQYFSLFGDLLRAN